MFYFKNIEFLYLLILLFPLIYLIKSKQKFVLGAFSKEVFEQIEFVSKSISKKTRAILLLGSFVFTIFAISRPVVDNGIVKIKSSFIDIVVALDISKSMEAKDIYPNRFEFEKNKFFTFLDEAKNKRIAIVAFSSQTFLISPLSNDYNSLRFLVKNLNFDYLNLKGTNIQGVLEASNDLMKDKKEKIVLIFSDGGDKEDFTQELAYAKKHNITIYVYNIGTKKGAIIKDDNQNAVLVSINENIKKLALGSGGAYLMQSLQKNDIKLLSDAISNKFKAKNENKSEIRDQKELFYYPLILAIILFFTAVFSLPRIKK